VVVKRFIFQVILSNKELQPITRLESIRIMAIVWTPDPSLPARRVWGPEYYGHCSIQVLLSSLEIIVHHIVYFNP